MRGEQVATARLQMFGQNIYLLIGLLFALGILIVLGIFGLTALSVS